MARDVAAAAKAGVSVRVHAEIIGIRINTMLNTGARCAGFACALAALAHEFRSRALNAASPAVHGHVIQSGVRSRVILSIDAGTAAFCQIVGLAALNAGALETDLILGACGCAIAAMRFIRHRVITARGLDAAVITWVAGDCPVTSEVR